MKKISRPSVGGLSSTTNFPTAISQQDANSSFSGYGHVASSPLRGGAAAAREIAYEDTQIPTRYPQRLSLYLQAPDYEISIEDFESLALSRLESKRIIFIVFLRDFVIVF